MNVEILELAISNVSQFKDEDILYLDEIGQMELNRKDSCLRWLDMTRQWPRKPPVCASMKDETFGVRILSVRSNRPRKPCGRVSLRLWARSPHDQPDLKAEALHRADPPANAFA